MYLQLLKLIFYGVNTNKRWQIHTFWRYSLRKLWASCTRTHQRLDLYMPSSVGSLYSEHLGWKQSDIAWKSKLGVSVGHEGADLHCDIIGGCWGALQHFVGAAAGAALKHHAGWDEDVLHLIRIFLQDIHQYLSGLTHTLVVHHHQWDHWGDTGKEIRCINLRHTNLTEKFNKKPAYVCIRQV